jgi:lipopolysaccharide transport system ATP-binding protein
MDRPIIEVENLSKLYRLGTISARTLRESVSRWWSRRRSSGVSEESGLAGDQTNARIKAQGNAFWALRDVSFHVQRGEVVGIVGRNGAGKSTLLKILSRITEPTRGRAVLRGRLASLLEVGTGFHPDLTGRENIYLNGAILGMKRAEIREKFDQIVAFSGVEQFVDTPVKRYSSGMYVRLAFAVAAHLEPDILIVDEVLAVGDAAFQKRCLGKMSEVAREGRTVLFVSHNMAALQTLCATAVLIENGRLAMVGKTPAVITRYLQRGGEDSTVWRREDDKPSASLQFESAELRVEGEPDSLKLHLEIRMNSRSSHRPAFVAVDILNSLGASVMQALPTVTPFITDNGGSHLIRMIIELPPLIPGHYPLTLWAGSHNTETLDVVERGLGFEIESSPTKNRTFPHSVDHGYIVPRCTWEYIPVNEPTPLVNTSA